MYSTFLEEIPINLIFSSGISRRLSLLVRRTLNFFLIVIAALKLICCSIIKSEIAISDLIIEQQISFKAAITIKKKFNVLLTKSDNLLDIPDEKIRLIGISSRKVEYIKNVYKFFESNEFDFQKLTDEETIKILCEIKGIGSWTAEMFLIFILFRQDIFSKKDLALINLSLIHI